MWHPLDELGYDVADHHIYISIQGLPQHLWKKEVVDQILHPYCALGDLSEETNKWRNLSSYTAFAWSQRRISMPSKISLKVMRKRADTSIEINEGNTKSIPVYNLLIQATDFLCDSTTHCSCNLENLNSRYESAYDADNAQYFLTDVPDNQDLLTELESAVVATTSHEDHGYQKEELQEMMSTCLHHSVKIHRLDATHFLILPADKHKNEPIKEKLLGIKFLNLPTVTFALDHWSTETMATAEKLATKIHVTVNQIPAHLCVPTVMTFLLSPYCAVEHGDEQNSLMPTSKIYTCRAWTNAPFKVPKRIMAALFARSPANNPLDEVYGSIDLRITQMLIDTTISHTIPENKGLCST